MGHLNCHKNLNKFKADYEPRPLRFRSSYCEGAKLKIASGVSFAINVSKLQSHCYVAADGNLIVPLNEAQN